MPERTWADEVHDQRAARERERIRAQTARVVRDADADVGRFYRVATAADAAAVVVVPLALYRAYREALTALVTARAALEAAALDPGPPPPNAA